MLTALWVDFSRTSSTTIPLNPDGSLPQPLADHRPDPPRRVDQATILRERPTYYFCYRLILLLYAVSFEYDSKRMEMELPQLLPDWGSQRYYEVKYLKPRRLRMPNAPKRVSPIAVSMVKGETMVVVIRGTIWREEWCKDFMYRWAEDDQHLFPGRTHGAFVCLFSFACSLCLCVRRVVCIHRSILPPFVIRDPYTPFPPSLPCACLPACMHASEGMYSVFLDFYEELEAEAKAQRPRHIFVTGHSLGAGLANMIGLRLQTALDQDQDQDGYTPDRVDVVGFGGPNTGDEAFAEAFRASVNSRHVIFLGHGHEPDPSKYTVGDVCAQYTCDAYPGCDVLGTGPSGSWYHYVRPHNQVRVCVCVHGWDR